MSGVRMHLNIAAPIARVWDCLADPVKLAQWLMESDLVPEEGAAFTFSADPLGTWDGKIQCRVKELVAHEILSFTWTANDIGTETLVTFHLEEADNGTRLTLTHTGFEGAMPGAEGRHAAGWTNALKSLKAILCGPDPEYDWSAFQITLYVDAPLHDVFDLWSTAEGLRRFWADEVTCTAPNDSVRLDGETFLLGDRIGLVFPTAGSTELEIINIARPELVLFRFGREYGWVSVRLAKDNGRTRIVLRQFGMPTDAEASWDVHANARGWWTFNLMNLKSVLMHGHDLRVRDLEVAEGLGARFSPTGITTAPMHDWSRFDVFLYIEASADEVLSRWRTARGIESFFVGQALFNDESGTPREGEAPIEGGNHYQWLGLNDLRLEGKVREATEQRIAFTFGARYEVEVTATPHGPGTLLRLHQHGMAADPRDRVNGSLNCRCCWIYFLTTLKSQLEFGVDLRDRNPETADAISVGYNR